MKKKLLYIGYGLFVIFSILGLEIYTSKLVEHGSNIFTLGVVSGAILLGIGFILLIKDYKG